jgi:hypothetical protein
MVDPSISESDLKERTCRPGLYEGRYEIRDGKVYQNDAAAWGRPGTGRGGGRRKATTDEVATGDGEEQP